MIACAPGSPSAVAGRGGYSRFVALAKVILPLLALALLSLLFLLAQPPGPKAHAPSADARQERLSALRVAGVTPEGAEVSFEAETVSPQGALTLAKGISARVRQRSGLRIDLRAAEAVFDSTQHSLTLPQEVRLSSSDGYDISAAPMVLDLTTGAVEASGPVQAHTPFGALEAGWMKITPSGSKGPQILFGGAVKLIYLPPTPKE